MLTKFLGNFMSSLDLDDVVSWCSGYQYCTSSFNLTWNQILGRFKLYSWRVGDSQCWGPLTLIWMEIRVNAFRRSTIPQKKFHNHHIYSLFSTTEEKIEIYINKFFINSDKLHGFKKVNSEILILANKRVVLDIWHFIQTKCSLKVSIRVFTSIGIFGFAMDNKTG